LRDCRRSGRRRRTNRSYCRRSRCGRCWLRGRRRHDRYRSRCLGCRRNSGRRRFSFDRLCHRRSGNRGHTWFHCGWRHAHRWRRHGRGRSHPRGLRCRILRFFIRFGRRFHLRFGFGYSQNVLAHLLRDVHGDRARVRLLFRDAVPRQQVNDGFGLHFEFAGQLVDSDLICVGHALRS
jgi:hypothetical protein